MRLKYSFHQRSRPVSQKLQNRQHHGKKYLESLKQKAFKIKVRRNQIKIQFINHA